ncbi:glycoside hydrolase family 11 protein [Pseudobutyrivibrio ruminis]|uniref:glycoside hydrolase family 11 protein n=1 Tax=Pseudobutyrivibrio ruminis TaxID=46206 RepID=UPI000407E564|nr:glycoside hydrolase family 11 protein [Pseudobutyrivibrio ruminis]
MKNKLTAALLAIVMSATLLVPSMTVKAADTIYNNKTGNQDGYDYELWKDTGNTSMTLNAGGTFDCSWSNINNALFRKGKKFDSTQTYQQIGNITFDYGCDYRPNGNSYLCVYGWTVDPLVEYYIVDSWGTWRPPGGTPKGQIQVDGGTYDVYETTRYNAPSIQGDTTFKQYFSVRTSKRTSGTISVSEHFKAWERMGMRCGKLYEAALNIEGYQSSGSASVYKNNMTVGGSSSGSSSSSGNQGGNQGGNTGNENAGNNLVKVADADKIQCETMTKGGQYTGGISSPFSGVALYGNNDTVKFTQNFTKGTHDFTLRGCSNNDNMARVDLKIGGQNKGTFYFGDANPAEYTIKNVSHGTGNQTVELVVTADDGQWDAYLDWLGIGGISSEGKSGSGSSSQGGNTGNTGNTGSQTGNTGSTEQQSGNTGASTETSGSTKIECEKMTKSGQYTGSISSPFNGVALYANNDAVKYTQNFTSGTHDFTLRACSNNDKMARVDLKIGGQTKGTFYYGDSYPAEYTIKNVSHGTGNQTIELVVTADDGQWDAYLDYLTISGAGAAGAGAGAGAGSSSNTGNNSGTNTQNQKLIALTFDDGPSSTTSQVLDVLEKYNVKATFFLIGQNVNSNTASIVQRQVKMGCELACHSYTHEDMTKMNASQIRNQIDWTASAIKNTAGVDVKFFRPPYISVNNTMYQNIDLPFIQGSMHNDWESSISASQRVNSVLSSAKDGDIILLHDFQGNSQTVSALPQIIEGLKNQGYTFVTVSELFEMKGVNPNVEYKIWSNVK